MTLQIDTPAIINSESFARPDPAEEMPNVFVGGWTAAHDYLTYRPNETQTTTPGEIAADLDISIFAPQLGLCSRLSALRARRRLNRAFRRDQRAFEVAMNAVAHDPAGERELRAIWTSRR